MRALSAVILHRGSTIRTIANRGHLRGFSELSSKQIGMAGVKLTPIPDVERLSDRVTRVLGCNPGALTLQGTNCYLVGTGKRKILIDTGNEGIPEFLENMKKTLEDSGTSIQEVVITHWHPDHVGGLAGLCTDVTNGQPFPVSKFPQVKASDKPLGAGLQYTFVEDGHVFATEGATLRAMFTPGHADDHMSLLLEEEQAVFSGDTVLGEGTSVFEDLFDYMKSLEKLLSLKAKRMYPAHGKVVEDPQHHISQYISHRNQREQQVLAVLQATDKPMQITDIVKNVYGELPEKLFFGACGNVTHHMSKLVKEGKVVSLEDSKYQVNKSSL